MHFAVDESTVGSPPAVQSHAPVPSLVRAWFEIARRPTRPVIFEWARLATRRWIIISLLVPLALRYVSQIVTVPLDAATTAHTSLTWWIQRLVNGLLVSPADYLLSVLATAYLAGYLARKRTAPIATRFERALRPYALAQVPFELSAIVFTISLAAFGQMPGPTDNVFLSAGPLLHLVLALGGCGVALAAGVYSLALLVNALSVGSGRSRLMCFVLAAVATILVEVAVSGVAELVGAPFGLHLWPFAWP